MATTLEPVTIERARPLPRLEPAAVTRSTHQDRLAFADAFRAIAILGVVMNHLAMISGLTFGGQRDDLTYLGAWGVNCFFVLSGFLLSRPYLEAIIGKRAFPSTRLFLTRRFFRIYPLYALAVIISAAALALHPPHQFPVAALVDHLTFLHGFSPVDIVSLNGPMWTMAVDAQFYLLLPIGALALAKFARKAPRNSAIGMTVVAIAAVVAISLLIRLLIFTCSPYSIARDPIGPAFVLARNAIGMGGAFALGMGLALLVMLGKQPSRVVASAIGAAGIACFFVLAWAGRNYGSSLPYEIVYDGLAALSAALILYGFSENGFNVIPFVRKSRFLAGLAALAYAVYLFHYLIIDTLEEVVGPQVHWVSGSPAFFFGLSIPTVIVTFGVAYVAHRYVEKPFLRLRDRNREAA
ncbi:MAG TPA: acyltransferase [Candidatus Acidoferrum sp.]|nr:acyltransferase [Candidatus Acidoferrum sp.]